MQTNWPKETIRSSSAASSSGRSRPHEREGVLQRRELRDRLRQGAEIASNRRDEQEMFVLGLRILRSALVYVNTLILQAR